MRARMRLHREEPRTRPRCAGGLDVPVTLVYADYDWSRPSDCEANIALFPGAASVELPETGHFAALERPTHLARILLST